MNYSGGCHCKKVRFEVELDLKSAISCNCSICAPRASLLAFAPTNSFNLISGLNDLSEYRFNTKKLQHLFCKTCGIFSFGKAPQSDGSEVVFINVRCLDNINLNNLEIQHFDGLSK